ncbi:unnamed protein product [Echinostoma caproni]|uniref:Transposase n=1 Tax=Echinostoma caproni TaxID=27848 RepID=A0A183AFD6_9TREM|nr:unnamed protein product [Echinostoma caproni]
MQGLSVLRDIWTHEHISSSWGESLIIPVFKKGSRKRLRQPPRYKFDPDRHQSASLGHTSMSAALREINVRGQQAGFRPGRGWIDQMFTLRLVLELRHPPSTNDRSVS